MIQYSNPLAIIVAACVGVGAIGAGAAYHYEATNFPSEITVAPQSDSSTGNIADQNAPTPAYLMAHPAALNAAEIQCQNSAGHNVVAICDNVHSAQSGLLAIQYRNAAGRKSQ
jgi:hypothetical protein